MPKAYIAAPYTDKSITKNKSQVYGEIKDSSYINFLDVLDSIAKESGFNTFLPHRDIHRWGEIYIEPGMVVQKSLEALNSCDLLITYPERSAGSNIELGWASKLNKKIIILFHENEHPSMMQVGLNGLTDTKILRFRDITDLRFKLRECLSNFKC